MDHLVGSILKQATANQVTRFEAVENHRLEIWTCVHEEREERIKIFHDGLKPLDDLDEWFQREAIPGSEETKAVLPEYHAPPGYILKGGIRLLVQLRRPPHDGDQPNKLPWADEEIFHDVSSALDLPKMYIPTMDHSSGIAEFSFLPASKTREAKFYFVAQNTDYHRDSWSLALSYNPQTCTTTGFFCMDRATDPFLHTSPESIISRLLSSQDLSTHPLLLPAIMFGKVLDSSVKHHRNLLQDIQAIEDKIGYVHGRTEKEQELRDEALDHRSLSRRLNSCKKHQASRDGRHQFWRQFRTVLLDSFDSVELITARERWSCVADPHYELKHLISFNIKVFESLEGRDVNYSERLEAQLKLLYSLIAQEESNYQATIASATAKDSAEIKTLTFLGFVFLPANLVASLFGIEEYNLTKRIVRTYFIWTIPLIGLVFALFYTWLWVQDVAWLRKLGGGGWRRRRSSRGGDDHVLLRERTGSRGSHHAYEVDSVRRRSAAGRV